MAGSTKINLVISATDNATKAIQKVNRSLRNLEVVKLARSFKQFSKASGLDQLAGRVKGVGVAAVRVGEQIAGATKYLAGFVGLGSAAALAAMTVEWGKMGVEITRTANVLGVGVMQFQDLRNQFTALGMDANGASAALESLGNTMEDATYGRNQQALVMMRQLGLELHRTKEGSIDTTRALDDLWNKFQDPRIKGNRQVASLIARTMGVGSMLPLLLSSPAAYQAQKKENALTGATMSTGNTAKADAFGMAMYRVNLAAQGLKNRIENALVPALTPLIDKFIKWEELHGEETAKKIADGVKNIAAWVGDAATKVDNLVQSFGGWGTAAKVVGGLLVLNVLGPTIQLGLALGSLTLTAIPAAIRALTAFGAARLAAGGFSGVGLLGQFGAGLGVAGVWGAMGLAAGAAGYGVGSGLDWLYGKGSAAVGGSGSFGSDLYGATHSEGGLNNPGNLRNPGGKGFQRFATQQLGLDAMAQQLVRYGDRGINTIPKIVNTYSPASDGNNPTQEIPQIAAWSGMAASANLNLRDPATLQALMLALTKKEGHAGDVNPAMAAHAAQQALHITVSTPPGMSVSASGTRSAKIHHSLQSADLQ